jgi:hypothetical protein
VHQVGHFAPRVHQAGEAVEQVDVFAHAQQREVLTLAVDVHQPFSHLAQQGQGHCPPVHPADGAAFGAQFTAEEQRLRVVSFQPLFGQERL